MSSVIPSWPPYARSDRTSLMTLIPPSPAPGPMMKVRSNERRAVTCAPSGPSSSNEPCTITMSPPTPPAAAPIGSGKPGMEWHSISQFWLLALSKGGCRVVGSDDHFLKMASWPRCERDVRAARWVILVRLRLSLM